VKSKSHKSENIASIRFKLAHRHFSAILQIEPGHVGALNGRGVCNFKMGCLEAALSDLTEALGHIEKRSKQKSTNILELVRVRRAMNKTHDGDTTLANDAELSVNEKRRGSTETNRGDSIAKQLLRARNTAEAHEKCSCLVNRAAVLVSAGNTRRAEADLLLAVSLGKRHMFETPTALHDLGIMRLRMAKFDDALTFFNKAVAAEVARSKTRARANSGNDKRIEDEKEAQDTSEALPFSPMESSRVETNGSENHKANIQSSSSAMLYMNRAVAMCAISPPMLNESVKDFDRAVAALPGDVNARYNRSIAKGMLGDLRGAYEDMNRAIALFPTDSRLYEQRGKVSAAMGRPKLALKDFGTALLLEPRP